MVTIFDKWNYSIILWAIENDIELNKWQLKLLVKLKYKLGLVNI